VDLVHVRDVCNCIYKFLVSSKNTWNETYNIGGGKVFSINELADVYVKATVEIGLNAPTKSYIEARSYTQSKGIRLPCLNIAKLQAKLDWNPSISIEKGVKEIIKVELARNVQG
jgi:nucleoside-diphosphate-sugar epimerase